MYVAFYAQNAMAKDRRLLSNKRRAKPDKGYEQSGEHALL